jgi:uncharacterized membrane protein
VPPPANLLAGGVLPDTVNGLPLHPLTVHATVVLIPLAALLGVVFVIPRLRAWARWPLGLVSVGAALSTWVSLQTGESFEESSEFSEPIAELVERHEELARQLWWMILGYAVGAVVCALVVGRRSSQRATPHPESGATASSARGSVGVVGVLLSVVLVLGAAAVGFQTYRVGDAGSKAVWGSTG